MNYFPQHPLILLFFFWVRTTKVRFTPFRSIIFFGVRWPHTETTMYSRSPKTNPHLFHQPQETPISLTFFFIFNHLPHYSIGL